MTWRALPYYERVHEWDGARWRQISAGWGRSVQTGPGQWTARYPSDPWRARGGRLRPSPPYMLVQTWDTHDPETPARLPDDRNY